MKKSNKTSKTFLIIVAAYCCVVLLVASFLLSSGAKYRAKISGRTETQVAELNAAVLENLAKTSSGTDYVQTPLGSNSDLVLWNLYPGMEAREYAFVVSNGTDTDAHASVDIEFSVMLRTMENVPLKYTLVCGDNEYPSQVSPYPTAIADEYKQASDTDWKEYTFYESETSAKEAFFRLTSTDLSIQNLKIRVEWPIITDSDVSKPTNDASYMNEVEIVNVLIKLSSAVYVEVPVTPVVDDDDLDSVGVIVLTPELTGGVITSTATDITYNVTYDAFRLKDGQYRYTFEINNGNRLYQDGVNVTTYTDYTIQVQIPVAYYTQTLTDFSLVYTDDNGTEHAVAPDKTDYLKYDILQSSTAYGSFVAVSASDIPLYESASDTDLQYRFYKVWSYTIPAGAARLCNRRPSDTDLEFTAYDVDTLALVCTKDEYSTLLMTGTPAQMIDTVYRRFKILIHASFTDGE